MPTLGWFGIVRLGLVQAAIGAIVMLATSLLNRVMVVEYALPAALPAGLVAWHYAVQLSRPVWGHFSDRGQSRTRWIVLGMTILASGAVLAVGATGLLAARSPLGFVLELLAFTMIGVGVGAAGTSLLAMLASCVAPERRAGAASLTWIMMIVGIVLSAAIGGRLVDPFSLGRLLAVGTGIAGTALLVAVLAVWGVERGQVAEQQPLQPRVEFRSALRQMLADREARDFTVFVFLSMLAYSMQDLILEPFAGLLFKFTPGQSTQLSSVQHGGVLAGMILVGVGAGAFGRTRTGLSRWIVGGCLGSAAALAGLATAARYGAGWPLTANIALLGFANGTFAVAAIAKMMVLAKAGEGGTEGIRMGVWGAAQAVAFGLGGLIGAIGVDVGRALLGSTASAFTTVFTLEAALFVLAVAMVARGRARSSAKADNRTVPAAIG